MAVLSSTTEQLVEKLFPPESRDKVRQILLEQCGNNLPMLKEANELELERVRYAALAVSQGTLEGLARAIQFASADWRDLLMEADFGYDLKAHEKWAKSVLGAK